MAANLVGEKLAQATEILNELDVDLWMLVARESDTLGDPSLPLVVGTSVTWESAFLVSRTGRHRAIVGTGDVENVKQTGAWTDVVGYVEGIGAPLRAALAEYDPRAIALNYSKDNNIADGLTYGMYLTLQDILGDTPYWARVVSGEPIASRVRARKSPEEQRRIERAVATTVTMWDELRDWLRTGVTERQVSDFLHGKVDAHDIGTSWDWHYCPAVSAGPTSPVGHVGPTDIAVQAGELLSVDFGVKQDGYTSDMQRTYYLLRPGETEPPEPVKRAFAVISEVIQTAARVLRPGVEGWEVDEVGREIFERERYAPWAFALGHQMGRACHDGGTVLGPRWERYGRRPFGRVEKDEVYTLEIGVTVPGYGRVSLEEDVVVTADGCRFLAEPQTGPILVG
ncbi:MAG TPA: M24 family metallopeptidase [Thermomicrobiaceae bacterium]|nr:M24 family metallopeptidase [Thermomicrobiaceae bacterium]